ncbi:MAG: histidine kinase dimerization/phospho-acceptor domain-containing protein, partial [Actinomycetota bacterium]|nr:histidine kinase dimerization/phospho-acceptor domain-containing protein [Actinomycetota bacterium]
MEETRAPVTDDVTTIMDRFTAMNNELLDAKRELTKRNIDLARLNRQKNQFLSIASHDLRNPMGAIYYFSNHLAKELKEIIAPDHIETLELIAGQTKYMLRLIADLLDFTRIDDGKMSLILKKLDLAKFIADNL